MIETHMPEIVMAFKKRKAIVKYDAIDNMLLIGKESFKVLLINRCHKHDKTSIDFARTVVHEAGHAFMYYKLTGRVPERLVIKNNSSTYGGYVVPADESLTTANEIKNKAGFYLGGMLAEEFIFGNPSNGASADLQYATSELNYMLMSLGLGYKYEVQKFDSIPEGASVADYSDKVEEILQEMASKCRKIFSENKNEFARLCKLVHEKCNLNEKDFLKFFKLKNNDGDHVADLETYNELIS
jgi:ATP-dependent Zn protease